MQHAIKISLVTILVLTIAVLAPAQNKTDDKKPKMTTAERLALLKTFNGEFVKISPGTEKFPATFVMGSSDGEASEKPARTVKLTSAFSIAKYEVPQNLWEAVMRAAKLIEASEEIRLPTEAEWEYCCRAGTTTAYSFGQEARDDGDKANKASRLSPFGWHTGNAAGNDPPVGALKPNPWGLYDMHGYLWEFVADAWHPDYKGAPGNSSAWDGQKKYVSRVIRSGSWRDRHPSLRSAARLPLPDHVKSDAIGLRCVKASTETSDKKKGTE